MDEAERSARDYLFHGGYTNIVHEPDGNVAPDFLVDGRIAVEVRRLNQNVVAGSGSIEGLEQAQRIIWGKITKLALSLSSPIKNESWFLGIDFCRPVDWKNIRPKLRSTLTEFMNRPIRSECTISLGSGLEISLFAASRAHSTFYVMGSLIDDGSGGWLLHEMAKNIQLCIAEKQAKIDRSKYPEWWLVLVDYMGLGLSRDDQTQLDDMIPVLVSFDRMVVIDRKDCSRAFELKSSSFAKRSGTIVD